jgi:hypothetical protein
MSTIAISLAKIINKVQKRKRLRYGSTEQIIQDLLIGKDSKNKQFIFNYIAKASTPILHEFKARELSNLIYAFGLAQEVVLVDDGSTFFEVIANQVISFDNLDEFNGQGISNVLWAYANVGVSNAQMFKKIADHIVELD